MTKVRRIFFAVGFLAAVSAPVFAEAEAVKLNVFATPARVTIGDEVKLIVRVSHPRGYSLKPLSSSPDLRPFEVKKIETLPVAQKNARVENTFVLTLTVFELGELSIPPLLLEVKDDAGRSLEVITRSVPVRVVSVGKNRDDTGDIRPIKGPVSLDLWPRLDFLLGAGAFLLSVFLAVKIFLRRRRKAIDLESLKPAHERAMLELERLQKKGFLEEGKVKEFYSELADILRRYLERRFQVDTLELTTAEIASVLKEKNFGSGIVGKVDEVLRNSDLVKFAKFVPPRPLAVRLTGTLVDIVNSTRPPEEAKNGR